MSQSNIKCPSCGHQFEATDALKDEIQKEFRAKATAWQAQKEEEYKKKEEAFNLQLDAALIAQKKTVEEQLRKNIAGDFENQLKALSESNKENEEKLKAFERI